ncbi:YTH domain-containing protein 1 [Bactrocera neohumeralis]|uniref:YTH domain-containing protein 1 n=1 Tax=Bactrocera tryoni TaxID=59916 RepID=UPI001A9A1DAA|nr:YTH domain-containing protein 1 [Bactrocera tryoni]XP_039963258.1 YTH domain-containing protein 1 [Bactrocera tryoni]XP_050337301.1 YTH domain-containing protein 1 [Bactrocera neohumeralis]XP_050337302.1 YTH domain-containing protein 1 [Bactrocera neohumeralis]
MKIMADLDAVHLGLDENEADIAEELQDFDDSFDTRSEASESGSESSVSQPSISSVSTTISSIGEKRKNKTKKKASKESEKKATTKRTSSPAVGAVNGKTSVGGKKKRSNEESSNKDESSTKTSESKGTSSKEKKSQKKASSSSKNSTTSVANSNGPANTSSGSVSAYANTSGNKSEASDAEDKPTTKTPFDSDSESEDSDSAANIKRNGRKPISKSASPEKKTQSGSTTSGKSYDYMTKLNYLFRGTHFFLIKSNNADNVAIAKNKNVWATLPQNEANLNQAFKESRNVLLIFSVNESGKFAGFARMSSQSRRDLSHPAWVLPPSISPKALGGIIELDWICRKELSFNCTSHLYNTWNESKPVKIGRDGQEIEPKVGSELCRLFPEDEKIEMTPILRKSKETAKMMREKGIRVSYRPPRSLSSRGSRGGAGSGFPSYRQGDRRAGSSGGPMRHRRTFSSGPHRPYKLPPLGMPPGGGFKRSSSPYRSSGSVGAGGSGGSRAGGGDTGLPSWDRYMNSAEAYMVDYMRSMHGQLPPLPFVPPFAQLPLSASGSGALPPPGPPSMYDQLPPPVRYYDGPPLPDYPPPQPIRPPPPGFDKAPSYEDFAAWKNAGLPTLPDGMPPGFPSFGSSAGTSASNGGNSGIGGSSSVGGSGGFSSSTNAINAGNTSGGPNSFRSNSQRSNNSNMMRPRERAGGRDYRGPSGGVSGGSGSRSGGNDRHFRAGGGSSGGARNYRDGRR